MKKTIVFSIITILIFTGFVSAELIRGIDIEFVNIGNTDNPGDTREYSASPYGCGAVGYEYEIGKYEITNTQWNTFVSLAGAPWGSFTPSWSPWTNANVPTNCVSWYEAAQFCNYLTSGDKSQGAYLFGDNGSPASFIGIDREAALSSYGKIYAIPTEDEWYKAAYYKPDGSGYTDTAHGTHYTTYDDANFNGFYYTATNREGEPWDVGSGTIEQNGTFDMMGNVWEWNESLPIANSDPVIRGSRGGSYYMGSNEIYSFTNRSQRADFELDMQGFRIVSVVPEPTTVLLLGLGTIAVRLRHRRQ